MRGEGCTYGLNWCKTVFRGKCATHEYAEPKCDIATPRLSPHIAFQPNRRFSAAPPQHHAQNHGLSKAVSKVRVFVAILPHVCRTFAACFAACSRTCMALNYSRRDFSLTLLSMAASCLAFTSSDTHLLTSHLLISHLLTSGPRAGLGCMPRQQVLLPSVHHANGAPCTTISSPSYLLPLHAHFCSVPPLPSPPGFHQVVEPLRSPRGWRGVFRVRSKESD